MAANDRKQTTASGITLRAKILAISGGVALAVIVALALSALRGDSDQEQPHIAKESPVDPPTHPAAATHPRATPQTFEAFVEANKDSFDGQIQIADRCLKLGRVKDALNWITLAQKIDHVRGNLALGHLYLEGPDEIRDAKEGIRYLKLAADSGDPSANFTLGVILQQRRQGGYSALAKAAEGGIAEAALMIAEIHFNDSDKKSACRWAAKAASMGDRRGHYMVAALSYKMPYPESYEASKAMEYIIEAERNPYIPVQYLIGRVYYEGRFGQPKDRARAIQIWRVGMRAGAKNCRDELRAAGAE